MYALAVYRLTLAATSSGMSLRYSRFPERAAGAVGSCRYVTRPLIVTGSSPGAAIAAIGTNPHATALARRMRGR